MIKNLNEFIENDKIKGNIFAYKNPNGKNTALANFIVETCLHQGRLINNKLAIASSGRFAVEVAKACKARNINFLPILGIYEDTVSFKLINDMGYSIDRTSSEQKEETIQRLCADGWYYFDQFSDPILTEYYKTEAAQALAELGKAPDIFIDFIGSGATMRGFYETLKDKCRFGYSNACYKDETKYERKVFIKDLIKNQTLELIDVAGTVAGHLAFRYSQGDFGNANYAARTFFTSLQGALNWLEYNPNKTVLLYWED